MVSLAISCILIGAALGLRFKVLILVPATAISLALIATIALFTGAGLGWALISAVVGTVSLQLGYLGGLVTGIVITAADLRAPQRAPRSAH
jgi:hypothetical protein